MLRGVSPLFIRMLRENAFSWNSHLQRLGFVGISAVMLLFAWTVSSNQAASGLNYFASLVTFNMVFLLTTGLNIFTGAIAEEREQGTLGLLKLTGLSRLSLLLGKSTTWLIGLLILYSLQLPFIALSVTLGGITFRQILAIEVSFAAFVILLCNMGLLSSLICGTSRQASALTGSLIGISLIVPWFVGFMLPPLIARISSPWLRFILSGISEINWFFSQNSVVNQLMRHFATGAPANLLTFQVVSNILIGLLCFLASWVFFEHFTRNPDPVQSSPRQFRLLSFRNTRSPRRGTSSTNSHYDRNSLSVWINPFAWQEFQFTTRGVPRLLFRCLFPPAFAILLTLGIMILDLWSFARSAPSLSSSDIVNLFFGTILGTSLFLFSLETLIASGRFLGDEFREATLSTLLIVPRTLREIVYSKVKGISLAMIPYGVYLFISALCLIRVNGFPGPAVFSNWILTFIHYILILHFTALFSLNIKRGAIGLGLISAYLYWVVILMLVFVLPRSLVSNDWGLFLERHFESIMGAVTILLIALLHNAIFNRIRFIAAQGGV